MTREANIVVTNHATIRYLEQVAGVDMDRIRRGIQRKVRHAVNAGARSITVDGFEYRISEGRIVTIEPADDSHEPAAAFDALTYTKGQPPKIEK